MARNGNLAAAKKAKNDEFYTLLTDIEKELWHYTTHFKDKIVFCNCDDPEYSNFWQYFDMNFDFFEMKGLIATHYDSEKPTYKLEIWRDEVTGQKLPPVKTNLVQNGDFRSEECIELLKKSDIVVTNPPWSAFREYVEQLVEYGKDFAVIGNKNAIIYKEIFPLIKDNKVWFGYGSQKEFTYPDGTLTTKVNGLGRWYTNLDIRKRYEPLALFRRYADDPSQYPKYSNYDAINVDKVRDIPEDYFGVMGVPISFMDSYCPEQFEIVGMSASADTMDIPVQIGEEFMKVYRSQGGTGHFSANMYGVCFYDNTGKARIPYGRLFIKRQV